MKSLRLSGFSKHVNMNMDAAKTAGCLLTRSAIENTHHHSPGIKRQRTDFLYRA